MRKQCEHHNDRAANNSDDSDHPADSSDNHDSQPQQQTEASQTTPQDIPECEGSVEEIALGATVSSEIVDGDPLYFCVEIPTDIDSFTVSLTGLTADLDLYVGYPDLEMVQEGGVGLRFSDDRDLEDEVVTVDIDPDLFWGPGSYYIEVSASSFRSSTFSLTVTTP